MAQSIQDPTEISSTIHIGEAVRHIKRTLPEPSIAKKSPHQVLETYPHSGDILSQQILETANLPCYQEPPQLKSLASKSSKMPESSLTISVPKNKIIYLGYNYNNGILLDKSIVRQEQEEFLQSIESRILRIATTLEESTRDLTETLQNLNMYNTLSQSLSTTETQCGSEAQTEMY